MQQLHCRVSHCDGNAKMINEEGSQCVPCYHPVSLIHPKAAISVSASCVTVRFFRGAASQLFLCQTHPCLHTVPCLGGTL